MFPGMGPSVKLHTPTLAAVISPTLEGSHHLPAVCLCQGVPYTTSGDTFSQSCHFLGQLPCFSLSLYLSLSLCLSLLHLASSFSNHQFSGMDGLHCTFLVFVSKYLLMEGQHETHHMESPLWLQCGSCLVVGVPRETMGLAVRSLLQEPQQGMMMSWSRVLEVDMGWNNWFCNLFRECVSPIPTECNFLDVQ